jgi:hypothetical protein
MAHRISHAWLERQWFREQQELWKVIAGETIHVKSESPIGLLLYTAHHERDSDPISKGRRREPVLPRPKMRSKEHKPVDTDKL